MIWRPRSQLPSVTDHPVTMCFALPLFISILQAGRQAGRRAGNPVRESIKVSKCCECAIHLTCIYQWLASPEQRDIPHDKRGCPHCRAKVKDLADYATTGSSRPNTLSTYHNLCRAATTPCINSACTVSSKPDTVNGTFHAHTAVPPWLPIAPEPFTWT